jgi:hypothetical protein
MKHIAALALLSTSLTAQSASDTILQRERVKLQAERTADGISALYLPTYAGVGQRGQLQTLLPESSFQTTADPMFTLEQPVSVQVYQSAAVVTGVQKPGLSPRRVRFVRVWVRDGSDWKIAIHHGTPIAEVDATTAADTPARRTGTPLVSLLGDQAAVIRVHNALSEAYAGRDAASYERLTAPEFVHVTTSGQVIRRDQVKLDMTANQKKLDPVADEEVTVRIFGDVAVLMCRTRKMRADGTAAPSERLTRIFARKNGEWQQVLAQSTMIQRPRTVN